jgi:hypothetical protein
VQSYAVFVKNEWRFLWRVRTKLQTGGQTEVTFRAFIEVTFRTFQGVFIGGFLTAKPLNFIDIGTP